MELSVQTVQIPGADSAGGGTSTVVARLPGNCTRTDLPLSAASGPLVISLPQVTDAHSLRTMRVGVDLVVSARGFGALVLDGFFAAAASATPPVVLLADGTTLSAQDMLAHPGSEIALDACQPSGTADLADALGRLVPGAGGTAQAPAATPADPTATLADGGRFNSAFAPSTFDGLSFGDVGPLSFGRTGSALSGRGLLHGVREVIDLLGLGTNEAEAFIPFSDKPVFSPGGASIDTDALIANEGTSVYLSGLAGLVGIPERSNLTVAVDPFLVATLEHDNAGYQSIVGVYKVDGSGHIVDIDILWLNASLTSGDTTSVVADFFGQTADRTISVFVPPETGLGMFMIADGGNTDPLAATGAANRTALMDLFADLGIDPTTATYQGNLDLINAHLRFNPATNLVEVETDPGVYTPLRGETYYSHDPTLDTDFRSDLSIGQNAHTASGVSGGLLWIGFEDWPLRGDIERNEADAILNIGGAPGQGADLDYNDLLFSLDILYPPAPIAGSAWSPTTTIFSSLGEGLGALALASFTVGGLDGDGVTVSFNGLSPGWTLTPQSNVDGFGNGTYVLQPPGGRSTSEAMIAELNKIEIGVPGDPSLVGRQPVSVDFAVTDTLGHSETAQANLSFSQTGPSPPAPPDVQIFETYVPPPAITTFIETTV